MRRQLDISQQIQELINRNNVQIRSLELLGKDIRELYQEKEKKAILIIRSKVYERTILDAGIDMIDIYDSHLAAYVKKEERIIIVLPSGGKKRYVLQTQVTNIFFDFFRVQPLDPRLNERIKLPPFHSVHCRLVPDTITLRLQEGELRLIRKIEGVPEDIPDTDDTASETLISTELTEENSGQAGECGITDTLHGEDNDIQDEDHSLLLAAKKLPGTLVDVSIGGLCMTMKKIWPAEIKDQLVYVEFDIETMMYDPMDVIIPDAQISIASFAIVRTCRFVEGKYILHLMYLTALPAMANNYFPRVKEV